MNRQFIGMKTDMSWLIDFSNPAQVDLMLQYSVYVLDLLPFPFESSRIGLKFHILVNFDWQLGCTQHPSLALRLRSNPG